MCFGNCFTNIIPIWITHEQKAFFNAKVVVNSGIQVEKRLITYSKTRTNYPKELSDLLCTPQSNWKILTKKKGNRILPISIVFFS